MVLKTTMVSKVTCYNVIEDYCCNNVLKDATNRYERAQKLFNTGFPIQLSLIWFSYTALFNLVFEINTVACRWRLKLNVA
jgi:hypothetical protein